MLYICMCVYMHMGDQEGQRRMWDPLEPELQAVVSCQIWILCKGGKCSSLVRHLSSPTKKFSWNFRAESVPRVYSEFLSNPGISAPKCSRMFFKAIFFLWFFIYNFCHCHLKQTKRATRAEPVLLQSYASLRIPNGVQKSIWEKADLRYIGADCWLSTLEAVRYET